METVAIAGLGAIGLPLAGRTGLCKVVSTIFDQLPHRRHAA